MPANTIAQTRITEESHWRFAALSGDLNPIHADAEAAKLMEPGALLAYGMDMVLWALESLSAQGQLPLSFARVRARFVKWVYLEEEVTLRAGQSTREGQHGFELLVNAVPVATLELFTGERVETLPNAASGAAPRLTVPRELMLSQMTGVEGIATLPALQPVALAYPKLADALGASAIAELAACSYIIGMEAPGLRSMSMRYDLHLTAAAPEDPSHGVHFQVAAVDERFRKAKIAVAGTHIRGMLEAIVRVV